MTSPFALFSVGSFILHELSNSFSASTLTPTPAPAQPSLLSESTLQLKVPKSSDFYIADIWPYPLSFNLRPLSIIHCCPITWGKRKTHNLGYFLSAYVRNSCYLAHGCKSTSLCSHLPSHSAVRDAQWQFLADSPEPRIWGSTH